VANVNDPAILSSNLNVGPFLARVWKYTPHPTPSGRAQMTRALDTYTSPTSSALVTAAADVLTAQLDSLINVLLESGRLRRA
jgi:hypothetical protein